MVCFIFHNSLIFFLARRHTRGAALTRPLARRLHHVLPHLRGTLLLAPDALTIGSPRGCGCGDERRGMLPFSAAAALAVYLASVWTVHSIWATSLAADVTLRAARFS